MQLTWELKNQASSSSKSTPTFAAEKNPQQDDKPSLGAFRDVMSGSPTNINVFLTLLEDENKLANHSTASRTRGKSEEACLYVDVEGENGGGNMSKKKPKR